MISVTLLLLPGLGLATKGPESNEYIELLSYQQNKGLICIYSSTKTIQYPGHAERMTVMTIHLNVIKQMRDSKNEQSRQTKTGRDKQRGLGQTSLVLTTWAYPDKISWGRFEKNGGLSIDSVRITEVANLFSDCVPIFKL